MSDPGSGGVLGDSVAGWAHGVYGFLLVVIIGVLIVGSWSLVNCN